MEDQVTAPLEQISSLLHEVGSAGNGKPARPVFYRPAGCEQCAGTGYRGRIGIYELLVVDEPVRREILNNSDSKSITRVAAARIFASSLCSSCSSKRGSTRSML